MYFRIVTLSAFSHIKGNNLRSTIYLSQRLKVGEVSQKSPLNLQRINFRCFTVFRYSIISTIPKMKPVSISQSNLLLDGLSPADRTLFCSYGSGPNLEPSHSTISHAIEWACESFPDETAATLVEENGALSITDSITYFQLSDQSNKLASLLQENGVTNGSSVCLFLKRGISMVVGISAVVKVGASYVPQHVGVAPSEQLQFIASATQTKVILTDSSVSNLLPKFEMHVKIIEIDKVMSTPNATFETFHGPHRQIKSTDICYIIFTSGTTGRPKGVKVTHGNLANVLLTPPMDLGIKPGIKVSQILSIAFDMGAWEILGTLTHGGTLVIRGRDIAAAVKHADVVISTPTVLSNIDATENTHVRTVAVAGEPCPKSLALAWARFASFFNSCGPTEVTIVNTAKKVIMGGSLNIGRPLANNTVYILDPISKMPCKIGQVGEMWAGGRCVTNGYLNNKALTLERYVNDPFIQNYDENKMLMYNTGDLGRWNENGELEHFGRADDQVKVRGFRVELDGISTAIEELENVEQAVVLKIGTGLVAWVSPQVTDFNTIRNHIKIRLPYYCVPDEIFSVATLPMTGNGKINKKKLLATITLANN